MVDPLTLTQELSEKQVVEDQTIDNVVEQPFPLRKLVSILLGAMVVVVMAIATLYSIDHSDPYVKDVLRLEGNIERGTEIFLMNCATCHGLQGKGEVGPSLQNVSSRKSEVGLIRQVVSGKTPPMPQFQPSPQDMADLLDFLQTL